MRLEMESRAAIHTQGWKGREQDGDGREDDEYLLVYVRERGQRLRRRGGHDSCGGLGEHSGPDDCRSNGDGGHNGREAAATAGTVATTASMTAAAGMAPAS